jgi:hypothetical protein
LTKFTQTKKAVSSINFVTLSASLAYKGKKLPMILEIAFGFTQADDKIKYETAAVSSKGQYN